MGARSERGEGGFVNFVWFILLAAVCYAAWNLIPVYFTNYSFKDKLVEICRTPRPTTDEKIMDLIMKEAMEQSLTSYMNRQSCRIQTLETSRRISCSYTREAQVLPGWRKVIQFNDDVDQPLIW